MAAPAVNLAASYNQTNDNGKIGPSNPNYSKALGDKTMASASARLGPIAYFIHVMRATFDPTYDRDNSIAHQYEKPQTRFPLAETERPHERSEKSNAPNVRNITEHPLFKPKNDSNAGKTEDRDPYKRYNNPYVSTSYKAQNYKAVNNDEQSGLYRVVSIVKVLEKRARQYFSASYRVNRRSDAKSQPTSYQGLSARIASFGKKIRGYSKKAGYNPKQQASSYSAIDVSNFTAYVLPISYATDTPLERKLRTKQDAGDLEAITQREERELRKAA